MCTYEKLPTYTINNLDTYDPVPSESPIVSSRSKEQLLELIILCLFPFHKAKLLLVKLRACANSQLLRFPLRIDFLVHKKDPF